MIVDGHCHLASTQLIPDELIAGSVRNVTGQLRVRGQVEPNSVERIFRRQFSDDTADRLVEQMDVAGVDVAVLMAPDFSVRIPGSPGMLELATAHEAVRRRHPDRFRVFIGLDPRSEAYEPGDLERLAQQHQVDGVKLYPPCGFSPSDRIMYPYYEVCSRYRLPVLVHTGPTADCLDFSWGDPLLLGGAVRDFPEIDFIIGHGALFSWDRCVVLARERRNVYLDTAGLASAPGIGDWRQHLRHLLALGVSERIIFGSDWPLARAMGGLPWLLDELTGGADPVLRPGPATDLFLGGNMLRLLPGRRSADATSELTR